MLTVFGSYFHVIHHPKMVTEYNDNKDIHLYETVRIILEKWM